MLNLYEESELYLQFLLIIDIEMVQVYHQTSNIKRTLANKIVDHLDVVGASPVGAAPTESSFST